MVQVIDPDVDQHKGMRAPEMVTIWLTLKYLCSDDGAGVTKHETYS